MYPIATGKENVSCTINQKQPQFPVCKTLETLQVGCRLPLIVVTGEQTSLKGDGHTDGIFSEF